MKIYFNAFWPGFIDKTDTVNVKFFLDLFIKSFKEQCQIGDINNSDILCESLFGPSALSLKNWKYTILFSGESRLRENIDKYTIILYSQRNNKNIVNCPEFFPYIYCQGLIDKLKDINNKLIETVPTKQILVLISNTNEGYRKRLEFIEKLDKKYNITYAGAYKNNIGGRLTIPHGNNEDFINYISNFKFVISMENSIEDTYITEKIIHGFNSKIIPIYWGTERVKDYFNKDRFITVNSNNYDDTLLEIDTIMNDDKKWLEIVNRPVFAQSESSLESSPKSIDLWITINTIANNIRCLLKQNEKSIFRDVSHIYCISNPEFENDRYKYMSDFFNKLYLNSCHVDFICPTYKHTITDSQYNYYTKSGKIYTYRKNPMKRSELSLFFNTIAILKEIDRNYLEGIFCIFESDINILPSINDFSLLTEKLKNNMEKWNSCHVGSGEEHRIFKDYYEEEFTNSEDKIRVIRKNGTRYADSILFNKKGVEILLNYMLTQQDFCEPYDCYLDTMCKDNPDFKFTWTAPSFFYQMSLFGGMKSNIQLDKE